MTKRKKQSFLERNRSRRPCVFSRDSVRRAAPLIGSAESPLESSFPGPFDEVSSDPGTHEISADGEADIPRVSNAPSSVSVEAFIEPGITDCCERTGVG